MGVLNMTININVDLDKLIKERINTLGGGSGTSAINEWNGRAITENPKEITINLTIGGAN